MAHLAHIMMVTLIIKMVHLNPRREVEKMM